MSEEKNAISSQFFENSDRLERMRMYEFILVFNSLLKALRLYGPENDTVEKNIGKVGENIKLFFISDKLMSLAFNGNDFLINETRVKKKRTSQISFEELEDFFVNLQIASIFFPKDIRPREIVEFLLTGAEISKKSMKPDTVFDHFSEIIRQKNLKIEITRRDDSGEDDLFSILDKSQIARLIYRNMVNDNLLFRQKIKENRPMPLRKAMRNVQNTIDLLMDGATDSQESHLLTLASLNSLKGRFMATHLANTTILSIAAGIQLGIERDLLTRIGIAAYFHDIAIPETAKGETVEHSKTGFAYLSRLNSLNFAMMEAAITAGLHHSTYTFAGEPVPPEKPIMSTPLGEIIKVCDYYDLVTRWWPARKNIPLKRPSAIEIIFKMSEMKCFSGIAAKALFSALGIFPPGTIVRVIGKNRLACSLDVFRSTGQKSKAAVIDSKMNFLGIESFFPHQLVEIPEGLHFRLPAITIKRILDSFDSQKQNDLT
ncbi:MAG TPA: hypothetical protein PKG52_04920 [bacterium]|nr:hypothetical protein [bacterium]HPS30097.1 hypothetical protein [bacterium]